MSIVKINFDDIMNMRRLKYYVWIAAIIAACQIVSCNEKIANPNNDNTSDTTTSNYIWYNEDIGVKTYNVTDIEAVRDGDIYVCGVIGSDSSGTYDSSGNRVNEYNVARKLGNEWQYYRLPNPAGEPPYWPYHNIKLFGSNEVWISGVGGFAILNNGIVSEYRTIRYNGIPIIREFIGNRNKIYIPNGPGEILVYENRAVSPISYASTELIQSGCMQDDRIFFILRDYNIPYENTKVVILKDNITKIWDTIPFRGMDESIWCDNRGSVYFCGDGGLGVYNSNKFVQIQIPGAFSEVRGRAWNDVFVVGGAGSLYHYNGISWRKIHLEEKCRSYILSRIALTDNTIYITAFDENGSYLLVGKKQ